MYNHQDKYNEDAHTVYAVFAKGWLHEHVQRDAVDTAPRIRSLNSQWVEQFVDKWNQSILKWYCSENWTVSSVTVGAYPEPTLSQRPHERPIGTLVLCLHPVVELTRQIWHRMQCHEGVSYTGISHFSCDCGYLPQGSCFWATMCSHCRYCDSSLVTLAIFHLLILQCLLYLACLWVISS